MRADRPNATLGRFCFRIADEDTDYTRLDTEDCDKRSWKATNTAAALVTKQGNRREKKKKKERKKETSISPDLSNKPRNTTLFLQTMVSTKSLVAPDGQQSGRLMLHISVKCPADK